MNYLNDISIVSATSHLVIISPHLGTSTNPMKSPLIQLSRKARELGIFEIQWHEMSESKQYYLAWEVLSQDSRASRKLSRKSTIFCHNIITRPYCHVILIFSRENVRYVYFILRELALSCNSSITRYYYHVIVVFSRGRVST